jgi:hypothetical protein
MRFERDFMKENIMSSVINPEAAEPSSTQAFEQSDRNPFVTELGGAEADGGQMVSPAPSESRITEAATAPSADAGLQNYNTNDSADGVEDEAEREGWGISRQGEGVAGRVGFGPSARTDGFFYWNWKEQSPHFSQRTREMGHPAFLIESKWESDQRESFYQSPWQC